MTTYFTIFGNKITWEGDGYYILTLTQEGVGDTYVKASTLEQLEAAHEGINPCGPIPVIYMHSDKLEHCPICRRAKGDIESPAIYRSVSSSALRYTNYRCEDHKEVIFTPIEVHAKKE